MKVWYKVTYPKPNTLKVILKKVHSKPIHTKKMKTSNQYQISKNLEDIRDLNIKEVNLSPPSSPPSFPFGDKEESTKNVQYIAFNENTDTLKFNIYNKVEQNSNVISQESSIYKEIETREISDLSFSSNLSSSSDSYVDVETDIPSSSVNLKMTPFMKLSPLVATTSQNTPLLKQNASTIDISEVQINEYRSPEARMEMLNTNINTVKELNMLRVTRETFELLMHLRSFNEIIRNTFVRIRYEFNGCTGVPAYRVFEIIDLVKGDTWYQFGTQTTNLCIKVKHGTEYYVFGLEFISNNEFTEIEFYTWYKTYLRQNLPTPSRIFLQQKVSTIESAIKETTNPRNPNPAGFSQTTSQEQTLSMMSMKRHKHFTNPCIRRPTRPMKPTAVRKQTCNRN